MNEEIFLNDAWQVRFEALTEGPDKQMDISKKLGGWFNTSLPCDVHVPMFEYGIISEPLELLNYNNCEWMEEKSWWFKKEFEISKEFLSHDCIELHIQSIDCYGEIFINDVLLGQHKSAFFPFVKNVKSQLFCGINTLLIRVTPGTEQVSNAEITKITKQIGLDALRNRGDRRRAFIRKPQYVFGWDWAPRIVTCGIPGYVRLEAFKSIVVRDIYVHTRQLNKGIAYMDVEISIENFHPYATRDAKVILQAYFEDEMACMDEKDILMASGLNFVEFSITIPVAKVWWPNGMGEQPLYSLKVEAYSEGIRVKHDGIHFGIRTISLSQKKINEVERRFTFVVNGVEMFCKGSNWVPADSIYSRISNEKYEHLIKEARNANMNMLRVWGGGLYERDVFYEKCDEYGILVWQDFMFACDMYPDENEEFCDLVEKELEYQTRRLRNHCCLALWCGNNENHWAFRDWWINEERPPYYGGEVIYNRMSPMAVYRNCPHISYVNSSPFGGANPNSDEIGDKHCWFECSLHPDFEKRLDKRQYHNISAKFVSEFGHIGPCSKSSVMNYLAGQPADIHSEGFKAHVNSMEDGIVLLAIKKHYLGEQADINLDDYLLYGGLYQGIMLEYAIDSMRSRQLCSGSLTWMYNDCWGETGWSIIDYYTRRKISYYFVKRAFAPLRLVLREMDGYMVLTGINDTPKKVILLLEYGFMPFDGAGSEAYRMEAAMEPFSRKEIARFDIADFGAFTRGLYYTREISGCIDIHPAILSGPFFREAAVPHYTQVWIEDFTQQQENQVSFIVTSDRYTHAVHFNLPEPVIPSDEYFDLLPGERHRVTLYNTGRKMALEDLDVFA